MSEVQIRDARTANRFFVDNAIIRKYGAELGPYGIATYCALCMHADLASQSCWPSHATIAKEIGCGASTVKKALDQMQKLGLIAITPRIDPDTGSQTSNLYILLDVDATPVTEETPIAEKHPSYEDTPTWYAEIATNNHHSNNIPLRVLTNQNPSPGELEVESTMNQIQIDVCLFSEQETPYSFSSLADLYDWCIKWIRKTDNRPAALRLLYLLCFGGKEEDAPNFGYLGKVAKQVGGSGRLVQLLWQLTTKRPSGDVLAYILAMHKAKTANSKEPSAAWQRIE